MTGRGFVPGGEFVLDAPAHVPAVWGDNGEVLWAEGESLFIVGPTGVGKTTLAQQVALARAGVSASLDVLGFGVTPDSDRRVLYVAADRPKQVARSMRRMVSPSARRLLDDRLVVWPGPLPFSPVTDPSQLAVWLAGEGISTIIIDSLKDVAVGLSEDTVGAAVNLALQHVVAAGIEVLVLHHQRKGDGVRKPRTLEDVYGSTWLVAGAGSVILLWGEAGDPVVELRHLKQPAEEVGPFGIEHDHVRGRSCRVEAATALDVVRRSGEAGITALEVARALFRGADPTRAQKQNAARKLNALINEGHVEVEQGDRKTPAVYRAPCTVVHLAVHRAREVHAGARLPGNTVHAGCTGVHDPWVDPSSSPLRGERAPDRAPLPEQEQALLDALAEKLDAVEEPVA